MRTVLAALALVATVASFSAVSPAAAQRDGSNPYGSVRPVPMVMP